MKKTKREKLSPGFPELIEKPLNERKTFFQKVYQIVKQIPEGKVTTYGHIARAIGNKGKARTVGYALHSVISSDIPCHRVVNRNGELTGSIHFVTPTLMKELLEAEKIEFINDRVNLKKHLWMADNIN